MKKKVLIINFITILFALNQNSNADFWEEKDGWIYNDNGSHKARTHVLTALHKSSSAIWRKIQEVEDFRGQPLQKIIDIVSSFKGDDFRDYFDIAEVYSLFFKTMTEEGIGKKEVLVWETACSKRTSGGIRGFLEGIDREINWIAKSDPVRGIKLIRGALGTGNWNREGEVDYM